MSIRRDERAVSEVVGALMLVIVVTAAVASFAAFTLDQQEKVQELKSQQAKRDAEAFKVLAAKPTDPGDDDQWDTLSFTVQALSPHDGGLFAVSLNGDTATEYALYRLEDTDDDGDLEEVEYLVTHGADPAATTPPELEYEDVRVAPRERLRIELTAATDFPAPPAWYKIDAMVLGLTTSHLNQFDFPFVPPNAIALASQVDADTWVLDGSLSDHPGGTVVSWSWSLTDPASDASCPGGVILSGGKTSYDPPSLCTGMWGVVLTVTDSHGFTATATGTFTV